MKHELLVEQYIKEHGRITQKDAVNIGVYRLAAVVWRMREHGKTVLSTPEIVPNRYGGTSRIAVYSFPKEGGENG